MKRLQQLSEKLKKCGFDTEIFESGNKASNRIRGIVNGCSVGVGSSMTLECLGLLESLKSNAKEVFFHLPGGAGEEERKALTADFYLTSANAISMDGHIVNIDGTGNRVAATCFGPKQVIYVVGKNKITETLDGAMVRAKNTAVKLAKHFGRRTPCIKTGECEDCLSAECICSITTIHRKKPYGINISVFLIDEELGL
ncbi:lactate utilization protein [Candidatus Bathyarchaeota archaeon]|jgi:hypothetical protein|nr:lactate utilization protein [Candidatus Bathyarchaeota archaeon]